MKLQFTALGLFCAISLPLHAETEAAQLQEATEIAKRHPLIDGHIDVPIHLNFHWRDVGVAEDDGEFDLPRAKAGGLDAPFMSIYIPADKEADGAFTFANTLIDQVEAMVYRQPNDFAIATTAADIRENFTKGLISLPMGMENGAPIEGNLENLHHFYKRGIRYITLCHSKSNHIADSSYDDVKIWDGLSPFGRKLVKEMNRLGIMIDIAHVSDAAFYEAIELSEVPVVATHSSLRHFTPGFERNVDDSMLKALAAKGGVIMINFGSSFVSSAARQWEDNYKIAKTAYEALQGDHLTEQSQSHFDEEYREKFPYPFADVTDIADQIDYAKALVGIEHIGLGSDFDGVGDSLPTGLKDVAAYPNLIAELLKRGYQEPEIAQIMGGNLLRVMEQNEAFARKYQASGPDA